MITKSRFGFEEEPKYYIITEPKKVPPVSNNLLESNHSKHTPIVTPYITNRDLYTKS